MKLLNIILSFYLLALSGLPCADAEAESTSQNTTQQGMENHSHDKQPDLCSPFCVCNCCGQQTLANFEMTVHVFPVKQEEISTSTPIYTSPFHSDYYGNIWQPPQIV